MTRQSSDPPTRGAPVHNLLLQHCSPGMEAQNPTSAISTGRNLGDGLRLRYLLKVDVVQVMRAANSLHHPAFWSNHIQREKGRLWDFHKAGNWTRRHCAIGQERHIRLQDKTVKAAKKRSGDRILEACSTTQMSQKQKVSKSFKK